MKMEMELLHIKKLAECFNDAHCECESQNKHLVNTTPALAPLRLKEVLKTSLLKYICFTCNVCLVACLLKSTRAWNLR